MTADEEGFIEVRRAFVDWFIVFFSVVWKMLNIFEFVIDVVLRFVYGLLCLKIFYSMGSYSDVRVVARSRLFRFDVDDFVMYVYLELCVFEECNEGEENVIDGINGLLLLFLKGCMFFRR